MCVCTIGKQPFSLTTLVNIIRLCIEDLQKKK